jgi:hypothetical protein
MPRDSKTRWYKELDAANVGEYTVFIYETWMGEDREDPACQIEQWMSMFETEKLPDEYSTNPFIEEGNAPYIKDSRYSWRDDFEGLKGAVANQELRVVKETDHDALRHEKESVALLPDPEVDESTNRRNRWRHSAGGEIFYEDFLDAIDKVAENERDEDAWKIINAWRSRTLRAEERSI